LVREDMCLLVVLRDQSWFECWGDHHAEFEFLPRDQEIKNQVTVVNILKVRMCSRCTVNANFWRFELIDFVPQEVRNVSRVE
jgi:hypothetical protein